MSNKKQCLLQFRLKQKTKTMQVSLDIYLFKLIIYYNTQKVLWYQYKN